MSGSALAIETCGPRFLRSAFLKAQAYQDGHAGYSDPLDEQTFLVKTINFLEILPSCRSTAVVVMYDDFDGWYDHQMGPIVNTSTGPSDSLSGSGTCGIAALSLAGLNLANTTALGRLRVRTAAAATGDLPLGQAELRG